MDEGAAQSSTGRTLSDYWCYSCNKRVSLPMQVIEEELICPDCRNGFVELIVWSEPASSPDNFAYDEVYNSVSGSRIFQALRNFSQSANENDHPPSSVRAFPLPSSDARSEDELLRIDGWNRVDDAGEEVREDVNDEDHPSIIRGRDAFWDRMAGMAARSSGGRNRILEWAEILMVLEDSSLDLPERYTGIREDYLDSAGFEALLRNLAENDGSAKRGSPPASLLAVERLQVVEVGTDGEEVACAICKDCVIVGEKKTEMPCGHGYHHGCIMTWLGIRNSCPVCRFELPTDDANYEQERRMRNRIASGASSSTSRS